MRRITVPGDVFAALAAGAGGEHAGRFLAGAERSKHLLLVRNVVATAEQIGHERAWELAEAYDLLAGLHEDHPEAVERVLRHPPVGTWALRMMNVLPRKSGGGPLAFSYLPGMAMAAAVLAGATTALDLTASGGRVLLPSLGACRLATAHHRYTTRVTLRTGPEGGEVSGAGGVAYIPRSPELYAEGWSGVRRLSTEHGGRRFSVLLDDLDPYRLPEGWPAPRQRPAAIRQWQEHLHSAWSLLIEHHPGYADDVATCVTTFVPLHRPGGRTVSSTSRRAFGSFAASLPTDGRVLAALLSHEVQHGKLWALLDLVPLTVKEETPTLWYAPWRDDPRPIMALLQGAYAHLAVAAFWRVQRFVDRGEAALRAHTEYARWRQHTRDAIETLRTSGRLTHAGYDFVTAMAATIDGWRGDAVPPSAARRAEASSADHRRAWLRRNQR
ncbi:hypothetical protein Aph01nite_53910 [Acrocarpospora phusangensis]|uniref:HEXXH motif domain-containing protein n=1 Tax=Acrocarpospora phusangensis TaxID=1070424 RepID=A0A919QFR8_9ACTN|nr:HEXXH motif domain-containing protein [Acrocarpospora phusangensis]GIH27081.1 hypothetical protein Aph01nite_53910 [Acrocarpospora phusangensis]